MHIDSINHNVGLPCLWYHWVDKKLGLITRYREMSIDALSGALVYVSVHEWRE
jgi:hypothetical protein